MLLLCAFGTLAIGVSHSVRLFGGNASSEGRVDVYYAGQWLSICLQSASFGDVEAITVCRQMGYNSFNRSVRVYDTSSPSTTASISCSEGQNSLRQCKTSTRLCYLGLLQYLKCSNSSKCLF